MGCLFALLVMMSPRLGIIILWAFTNIVGRAFNSILLPLIGLIFAPWTTLFYILVASTGHVNFGGWLFIGIGLIMDLAGSSHSYMSRSQLPYSSGSKTS